MDDRIFTKLDKIEAQLSEIDKTLVRNTVSLEHHLMRTEQNEKLIAILNEDLKPIKSHVANLQGVTKAITVVSVSLSIVATVLKIMGVL